MLLTDYKLLFNGKAFCLRTPKFLSNEKQVFATYRVTKSTLNVEFWFNDIQIMFYRIDGIQDVILKKIAEAGEVRIDEMIDEITASNSFIALNLSKHDIAFALKELIYT
jgi:hypothetical protein